MQYCMPYPCYFLQGCSYPNLTTARVSDDRFGPNRWNDFLYTSRLASALGIWPWTDVFKSSETANVLLCTLSAGPVGFGDASGDENAANLFQSVRSDGVIVKPDAPILPLDRMYVADARTNTAPILAATWTDHEGLRTAYLFAANRSKTQAVPVSISPGELDLHGPVYVYDYFGGTVQRVEAGSNISTLLGGGASAYYVVAPVGGSGLAFLGDPHKFASNGRQRIASLQDRPGRLTVAVNFAVGEDSVTLHGACSLAPTASLENGGPLPVHYDPATGHFTLEVAPGPDAAVDHTHPDPIRRVSLTIQTKI
jgi:hypothetical protein